MPKYSFWRPHFMAPGPNVEVIEDKPISFNSPGPASPNFQSDGEEFSKYKYYRSTKILGKLFDAVDEHAIFNQMQNTTRDRSSRKRENHQNPQVETLEAIFFYIEGKCPGTNKELYRDQAIAIRDKYAFFYLPSPLPLCPTFQTSISALTLNSLIDTKTPSQTSCTNTDPTRTVPSPKSKSSSAKFSEKQVP